MKYLFTHILLLLTGFIFSHFRILMNELLKSLLELDDDNSISYEPCGFGKDFNCRCGDEFYNNEVENQEQFFDSLTCHSICQVIVHQKEADSRLSNRLVKLHDIVAGLRKGVCDVAGIVKKVVKAILAAQIIINHHHSFLASVLSSAFLNFRMQYKDILNDEYFSVLKKHAVSIPIADFSRFGKDAFFKAFVEACDNSQEMVKILQASNFIGEDMMELITKTLFNQGSFYHWDHYANLVCFVSKVYSSQAMEYLLKQSMTLWSDPVIAKAYVYQEVIHFTKLSLFIFTHLPPEKANQSQDMLIRLVGQGLPNHFSSTDPRSIQVN